MQIKRVIFIAVAAMLWAPSLWLAGVVHASVPDPTHQPILDHNGNDLGWYFYGIVPEEPEPEPEPDPQAPPPSIAAQPEPLSVEWFQKNMEKLEQRAVDKPTRENVRAMLYAERVMMDKGEVYARQRMHVSQSDPNLQDSVRLPFAGAARSALVNFQKEEEVAALKEVAGKSGLLFFLDADCPACSAMPQFINLMAKQTSFPIYVAIRNYPSPILGLDPRVKVVQDRAHSQRAGIQGYPAIAMLIPPNDVVIVNYGQPYFNTLTKRLIDVAFENELLGPEWYYRVNPAEQGLSDPSQFASLPPEIVDDPVAFVNYVADQMATGESFHSFGDDQEGEE